MLLGLAGGLHLVVEEHPASLDSSLASLDSSRKPRTSRLSWNSLHSTGQIVAFTAVPNALDVVHPSRSRAGAGTSGAQTLVTHPNGAVVPAYSPAVAAARARHLSVHTSENRARNKAQIWAQSSAHEQALNKVRSEDQNKVGNSGRPRVVALVAHPNGAVVPRDRPDVAAARAAHLALHRTL